jgi:hypothetical protein
MKPPMLVSDARNSPRSVIMAGMIVWKGRLPPASRFGWPGARLKFAPRHCGAERLAELA